MQTRTMSLIEAVANTAIGYGVAVLTQMAVFPLFGIHVSGRDQLGIGLIFTVVSLVRSYCLRRFFNSLRGSYGKVPASSR